MKILGLFAKSWVPGTVKTRLAAARGEVVAARVHRALLSHALHELGTGPWQPVLVFSPIDDEAMFQEVAGDWGLKPQSTGDLGLRLSRFIQEAFAEGASRVCVIGADCPALHRQDLETAFECLASNDLVLGPARDGGYYLIGMNQFQPLLFEKIPWSTSRVLTETLERATALGLAYHLEPEKEDIDDLESLQRNLRVLHESQSPTNRALAMELERIMGDHA